MNKIVSGICFAIILLLSIPFYGEGKNKSETIQKNIEERAVESVLEWLKIIDAGKYKEGWGNCSDYFKNTVDPSEFEKSLSKILLPLGKVVKREVMSKKFHNSLPGAPDGEYVMIQFNSKFENKKEAIETITAMKDKDGKLRVAGYYIK